MYTANVERNIFAGKIVDLLELSKVLNMKPQWKQVLEPIEARQTFFWICCWNLH
jgi:hypothetical protein